jgi:hypothetical protein
MTYLKPKWFTARRRHTDSTLPDTEFRVGDFVCPKPDLKVALLVKNWIDKSKPCVGEIVMIANSNRPDGISNTKNIIVEYDGFLGEKTYINHSENEIDFITIELEDL